MINKRTTTLLVLASAAFFALMFLNPLANNDSFTPEEMKQAQFEAKRQKKIAGGSKFNGPDEFFKLHRNLRTAEDENEPSYKPNYQFIERERAVQRAKAFKKTNFSSRTQALNFVERGPSNVPGRTRGIWVDPDDTSKNTFLAASASGGIWKTTDGGQTWECKTDNLPNLALTSLASSASDANIIYAGSGEGFGNLDGVKGNGIFKSTDRGDTWTQLPSTADLIEFAYVNRLAVDPVDADYVVAATNYGIYYTTDGGQNWTEAYSGYVQDLRPNPSDFDILYAAENAVGVLKSVDRGLTWESKSDGQISGGRYEIAVSPANPNRIFAAGEGAGASDLYVSDDGGETWGIAIEENNATNVDWLGGQGWYDNTLEAHPFNEDIVYAGGINQWRATILDGEEVGPNSLLSVDLSTVESYMTFVNFGATYFGGILETGAGIGEDDYVSVEFRFGPGQSQKAHRFTVPSNSGSAGDGGAGVAANQYAYQDYVDVPFEAWDVTNNKQLMVSFRDQERDGKFDLETENAAVPSTAREYLYVHTIDYDAANPNSTITVAGGQEVSQLYFMWPRLLPDATWDEDNLPESKISIKAGSVNLRYRKLENITDGYNQFGGKNSSVHVDQHNIVPVVIDEVAQTFKILIGNDGGVYSSNTSTDPGFANNSWAFSGNGYNTTQFYGIDKKPGSLEFIGGTQDNGTWKSNGVSSDLSATYGFMIGGDGFESIWNNLDPQKLIGGSQYNGFRRTTDGGAAWTNAVTGMADAGETGSPFISRLANSKSNPDLIFAIGTSGVWRSTNFGANWTLSPLLATNFSLSSTSNVDVSLARSKVVWAFNGMTASDKVHVSINGGVTFAPVNNYTERTMGRLTGFATHPNDWKTAYALFSFAGRPKVLKTTDLGQTWSDISGYGASGTESDNGFPNVAVYSLLVMPHNPDMIWAGTEIGIVESLDGGLTWNLADYNIPAVSIWEIKQVDDQIIIGTHGRGIWTVEIPELPLIAFDPVLEEVNQSELANAIEIEANLRSAYDSTVVYLNGEKVHLFGSTAAGVTTLEFDNISRGEFDVLLKSYSGGREYESYPLSVELVGLQAPELLSVSLTALADEIIVEANLHAPYDSTVVEMDGVPVYSAVNNSSGLIAFQFASIADGDYEVTLVSYVDGVEYASNSIDVEISRILSTPRILSNRAALLLYPNPNQGKFTIELGQGKSEAATITVYSYLGKVVKRMIVPTDASSSNKVDVVLDNVNRGMYLIEVANGTNKRQARISVQ